MKKICFILLIIIVLMGCNQDITTHSNVPTTNLRYLSYFPSEYDTDTTKEWPFILYLHGSGHRGNDTSVLLNTGIIVQIEDGRDVPFVVVAPQCPENSNWADQHEQLKGLVDMFVHHYRIDPNQLYVTGYSMGGYGTWSLTSAYPDLFAAAAPLAGGGNPEWAYVLKSLPIWNFHGDQDNNVPISRSEAMVDALREIGGDIKYTIFKGAGHSIEAQTYEPEDLFDWFLTHTKSE